MHRVGNPRRVVFFWLACVCLVATALVWLPSFAQAAPSSEEAVGGLFRDAPAPVTQPRYSEMTLVRTRYVTVDFASLRADQAVVDLNLFDGVRFRATSTGADHFDDGGFVWKGEIEGQGADSVVTLSVLGNTLQGNISTKAGEMYQIRFVQDGLHAIHAVDPNGFGKDGDSIVINVPAEGEKGPSVNDARPSGGDNLNPTINVMVVYTDDARVASGSTTAIQNLVNLAVSETNTGYANSGVNQRISLVYKGEVSYAESGNISTDLGRLRSTSDGHVDTVHSLRNTYAADLVAMVTENGGGYCGMAYLMTTVSNAFKTNGFSVTARSCATGYYSFGHELGHNMGARHDSYVDTGTTPYAYSHGWVNVAGRWRTIMAYNNKCADSGVSCTRINRWSNPNLTYGGATTGNASTAHNARVLNNTAATVAGFR